MATFVLYFSNFSVKKQKTTKNIPKSFLINIDILISIPPKMIIGWNLNYQMNYYQTTIASNNICSPQTHTD